MYSIPSPIRIPVYKNNACTFGKIGWNLKRAPPQKYSKINVCMNMYKWKEKIFGFIFIDMHMSELYIFLMYKCLWWITKNFSKEWLTDSFSKSKFIMSTAQVFRFNLLKLVNNVGLVNSWMCMSIFGGASITRNTGIKHRTTGRLTQLRQRELPLCLGYLVLSMFLLFFHNKFWYWSSARSTGLTALQMNNFHVRCQGPFYSHIWFHSWNIGK